MRGRIDRHDAGDVSMTAIPSRGESDFSAGSPLIDRPSRTRRASRAFVRYLIAIGIGVAGTLAWQSYGAAAKQTIAVNAPQLGWSPEAQQMIAGWVEELGWTKPPAAAERTAEKTTSAPAAADTQQAGTPHSAPGAQTVAQTVPEMTADTGPKTEMPSKASPGPSLEQVQQMAADLTALHQTVEQLTAGQDQMARDIAKMQAANEAILQKVSAPPPQKVSAPAPQAVAPPAHKRTSVLTPSSGAPLPLR
jgi:hypothetical protein